MVADWLIISLNGNVHTTRHQSLSCLLEHRIHLRTNVPQNDYLITIVTHIHRHIHNHTKQHSWLFKTQYKLFLEKDDYLPVASFTKEVKPWLVKHPLVFNGSLACHWLTLNVWGPSYLGLTRSISWLLMPWLLTSPGHQKPWYWLCRIGRFLSYLRKDLNYLRRINVEKWHKM